MVAVEWSEGFAIPIAPLVLLAQAGTFFLPRWWLRLGGSIACCLAIELMYRFVRDIDLAADEGVNIGAGILAFEAGISYLVLTATILREMAQAGTNAYRRRRDRV